MAFKEITAAGGIRNDVSSERYELTDLLTGTNIEIDETGKVWRRLGVTAPIIAGDMHSLWADAAGAFVVKDGVLGRLDLSSLAFTAITNVSWRVRYQRVLNSVFWTDGTQTGEITLSGNRTAGIVPPPHLTAAAAPVGALRAGTYLYTMTYVRDDGTESGAPRYGSITVDEHKGIQFASLPVSTDATVTHKNIYVSHWNGEVPMLAATLNNSTSTLTITELPNLTVPVRTKLMRNAPSGQVIGYYNGRLYVAENNYLWYSQPYEYGLFNPMENYIGFSTPITTFASVSDGLFVGSEDEIVFLEGDDPATFKRRQVASYGAVLGTEQYIPGYLVGKDGVPGMAPMWMSKQGVCIGLEHGEFKNLTGSRFILPTGVSQGASLLKVRGGTPQFVTSLL